jgi:energy-coupling factor transporter ATP-binding protein EcfA2
LAAQNWQGAIIGPHGSGKSTLLESLKPCLIAAGRTIESISLHDGQRRLPRTRLTANNNRLLIIDGYEQLATLERVRLIYRCRSARIGLLVTSHSPTWLPTLIRLAPDSRLVEQLVADLCAKVSTTVTPFDVAASHACHGSNVREILFDLYDRHEAKRRASNSLLAAS